LLLIFKQLSTDFIGDYVLISYSFQKIKLASVLFLYIFIPLNPLIANQSKDYLEIDMLVWRCYKDIKFCKEVLFEINYYQKNAAINKKLSCQTRLLGLEANLIMAMNSNFKRKEAQIIIDSIKKYC
tara:strand:- start:201 stop:578 length:378 start_codon:yes stop_codon:yes gene_type:complete